MTSDFNHVLADSYGIIQRLRELPPGERMVYYTGSLCDDRRDPHDKQAAQIVGMIADAAWSLMNDRKILLTQRRLGPPIFENQTHWGRGRGPGFEYIATGRAK